MKDVYASHNDLENMIENLSGNDFELEMLAQQLTDDSYGNNSKLSKELYGILIKNIENGEESVGGDSKATGYSGIADL